MPPPAAPADVVALVAVATLAAWGLVCWAWHAPVARAMRARGLPRWGLGDTLLVSPLFAGGTLVALGAGAWALARSVAARALGTALPGDVWTALAVGVGAVVVAAFGVRAVGKLY